MDCRRLHFGSRYRITAWSSGLYAYLAPRACSVIILVALLYTLAVKYFHSLRFTDGEFFVWILADISFLLVTEVVLSLICTKWPRKWIIRTATVIAAVICTWSILNAAWAFNGLSAVVLSLSCSQPFTICFLLPVSANWIENTPTYYKIMLQATFFYNHGLWKWLFLHSPKVSSGQLLREVCNQHPG